MKHISPIILAVLVAMLASCAGTQTGDIGGIDRRVATDTAAAVQAAAAEARSVADALAADPTADPAAVDQAEAVARAAESVASAAHSLAQLAADIDQMTTADQVAAGARMAANSGVLPWWGEIAAGVLAIGVGTYAETQRRQKRAEQAARAEAEAVARRARQDAIAATMAKTA